MERLAKTKAEAQRIAAQMKSMGFSPRILKLSPPTTGGHHYKVVKVAHYFPYGGLTRVFGGKRFKKHGSTSYAKKAEAEAVAADLRAHKPRSNAQVRVASVPDTEYNKAFGTKRVVWNIYTWGF